MSRLRLVLPAIAVGVALTSGINLAYADHSRVHRYTVHNLVSDGSVTADHVDPLLKNPWGIAFNPTGFVWVSNNESSTSTLYDGTGVKNSLTVTIPSGTRGPGLPTGIVFSGSADFAVTDAGKTGPSRFIFAGQSGTISGWAPTVNTTNAIKTYDAPDGAAYTGLAIGSNGTANYLYAADFHNAKIDVFDRTYARVALSGSFHDPYLPAGYSPFGIQNILGNIYVLYAKLDDEGEDEVAGPGLGIVSVFDTNGHFVRRFTSRGALNAPWGIALAPADFGAFSNRLLIGNFGDGTINAYDLASGRRVGPLRNASGRPLKIDKLWGLSFGNGILAQSTHSLFFTAGPNDEEGGLYGSIDATATEDQDQDDD